MTEPQDRELSRLYRETEALEPPHRIDDAILAASRRATGSRPRAAGSELVRRSSAPIALAATILLTFTVTLMVLQDLPEPDPAPIAVRPGTADARAEKPAQAEPGPTKSTPQAASRRDADAPRPAERALSSERTGASQPGSVRDAPSTPQRWDTVDTLSKSQRMQESPDVARRARESEAARARQAAPTAPAPSAGPRQEPALKLQGTGVVGAVAGRSAADEAKERSPGKWLEDIRALKAQGKAPEAERELAEFKKRYPDYRLPEDLR